MDKYLIPERFNTDLNSSTCGKVWKHWKRTFENFLVAAEADEANKLRLLSNYVSPDIYELIAD